MPGKEDNVGSTASLHCEHIIYNIYSSLDIYQKGHHLKQKSSNIGSHNWLADTTSVVSSNKKAKVSISSKRSNI